VPSRLESSFEAIVSWRVTLLNEGVEITIDVHAKNKLQAKREAHASHPNGHVVHVEKLDIQRVEVASRDLSAAAREIGTPMEGGFDEGPWLAYPGEASNQDSAPAKERQ
jgi:hypothetical protein